LVGGTAGFWGAKILGRRYGYYKNREAQHKKMHIERVRESIDFNDHEFESFMKCVNTEYHMGFKEWLVN